MNFPLQILGIPGSLRRGSFNRQALVAQGLVPKDARLDIFELEGIPVLNPDDEANPPARVVEFKSRIRPPMPFFMPRPNTTTAFPAF